MRTFVIVAALLSLFLVSGSGLALVHADSQTATVKVGTRPLSMAYDSTNGYVYVADRDSRSVTVLSGSSVVDNITGLARPNKVLFDPSNSSAYVTQYDSEPLAVISGTSIIANISIGIEPMSLAYDP